MTLDEAIKHCFEVVENCEEQAKQCDSDDRYERHVMHDNAKCATDHRQLAEWLTELKDRQWVSVDEKSPEEIGYYLVVIGNEMLIGIDIAEYSEGYWHTHDKVLYWQPLPEAPTTGGPDDESNN